MRVWHVRFNLVVEFGYNQKVIISFVVVVLAGYVRAMCGLFAGWIVRGLCFLGFQFLDLHSFIA